MTVNFHPTCRLIPHLLSSYSPFFHVSSVSDVFMLGLFNQGPYFACRKQLSYLLVVNKSRRRRGGMSAIGVRYLPLPGRFLLAVVGVFLNDGPGQVGVRVMSNNPKAQHFPFLCLMEMPCEVSHGHVFSMCTTPGISPAVQAANATSCGINSVCAMAEAWRKALVCLATKDLSSSCHQASLFVSESLGIQAHLRHLPLPSTLPKLE